MTTQTIDPVPGAGSDFLEVLQTFLRQEDAKRFHLQFRDFVLSGGLHGTTAGLTATPSSMIAFPGGYYSTETGAITYQNNVTTWVICDSDTTGDLSGYTRVAGTHYLISAALSAPPLPANALRLMEVTTSGGAITAVVDDRQLSPLVNRTSVPYVRMIGQEGSGADIQVAENAGQLVISVNTGTEDLPVWAQRIVFTLGAATMTLVNDATVARAQHLQDKDGVIALLSDIAPPTQWVTGDYKWNATSDAQADWLLCDGSAVSRLTYATLFAKISIAFGAGNGSTTFNLPDARGRFFLHASVGHVVGDTGGEETHLLTTAELPPHTHESVTAGQFVTNVGSPLGGANMSAGDAFDVSASAFTAATGSNQPHQNMPPFGVMGYMFIHI